MILCSAANAVQIGNDADAVTMLDNLKRQVQNNDDSVPHTFASLTEWFDTHPNDFQYARLLNIKAYASVLKQQYAQAYELLMEARRRAVASNNQMARAESLRLEGLILDLTGEHASAYDVLTRALDIFEQRPSKHMLNVYNSMYNVMISIGDFEGMLQLGEKYLAKAQAFNDEQDIGTAHFIIGYAKLELGQLEAARRSLLAAEQMLTKIGYPFIGIVYSTQAKLHIEENNLQDALTRHQQAADANQKVGFLYNDGQHYIQLADIYEMQNQPERALQILKTASETSNAVNDKANKMLILERLIELAEKTGDVRAALDYAKQYQTAYEQSFNQRNAQLLALNRVKLAVKDKEEAISLLEQQNRLQAQRNESQRQANTIQLYLIIGIGLSLILVASLWLRTRVQHRALDEYAKQLQRATDAKSDFLARMSHEIRTPLNAIIGLTRLTKKSSHSAQATTNLNQIENASKVLLAIINDILDFSKVEAGHLSISQTRFALHDLITQTLDMHRAAARDKGLTLSFNAEESLPEVVVGDPQRIQQILNNLLSNAVKFTSKGKITVCASATQAADKTTLEFIVSDTGIGLNHEQQQRLFEPFSQGDETVSRQFGGTGLGLAICKQLAELMGGRIWLHSESGKGSHFHFTVQVEDAESGKLSMAELSEAESQIPDFSDKTLLVAEDNPLNQKVTVGLLKETGAQVTVVSNGEQAVQLLTANPLFDAVLMDVQMPVMDGLTAARVIRDDLHLNVPIIAMTAHALKQDIDKSVAAGMNAHITKPIDPHELFAVLQRAFDSRTEFTLDRDSTDTPNIDFNEPDINALRIIDQQTARQALLNDDSLYTVVLHDFIRLESEIDRLKQAIDNKQVDDILRIVHIYTTALNYIGAFNLAQLASAVERRIQSDSLDFDKQTKDTLTLLSEELALMTTTVTHMYKQMAD